MLKRFFITGTDTSVGKTVVSRALLQALASGGKSVAGYKPVAKGSKETAEGMRNKDALVLQSVSSLELPYEAINPIALSEEESSVAHSCPINYTLLSNGLASLSDKVDHVVVEGTGGWRSLMNDLRPLSEWVVQEQLPVLMVVGIQEGCINHALLTAQAVANDGLPLIDSGGKRRCPRYPRYRSASGRDSSLSGKTAGVPQLCRMENGRSDGENAASRTELYAWHCAASASACTQ